MIEITDYWRTTHGDIVEVYRDDEGQYRWHIQARNGEVVGSGESHPRLEDAVSAAERHHPPVTSGE